MARLLLFFFIKMLIFPANFVFFSTDIVLNVINPLVQYRCSSYFQCSFINHELLIASIDESRFPNYHLHSIRIGSLMVSVLASSVVDLCSSPAQENIKNYKNWYLLFLRLARNIKESE
jgi:hypothetical protein